MSSSHSGTLLHPNSHPCFLGLIVSAINLDKLLRGCPYKIWKPSCLEFRISVRILCQLMSYLLMWFLVSLQEVNFRSLWYIMLISLHALWIVAVLYLLGIHTQTLDSELFSLQIQQRKLSQALVAVLSLTLRRLWVTFDITSSRTSVYELLSTSTPKKFFFLLPSVFFFFLKLLFCDACFGFPCLETVL